MWLPCARQYHGIWGNVCGRCENAAHRSRRPGASLFRASRYYEEKYPARRNSTEGLFRCRQQGWRQFGNLRSQTTSHRGPGGPVLPSGRKQRVPSLHRTSAERSRSAVQFVRFSSRVLIFFVSLFVLQSTTVRFTQLKKSGCFCWVNPPLNVGGWCFRLKADTDDLVRKEPTSSPILWTKSATMGRASGIMKSCRTVPKVEPRLIMWPIRRRLCAPTERLQWVQAVRTLGSEKRRRNNRLGNCGRVNHYCLRPQLRESMLRARASKIVFTHGVTRGLDRA